MSITCLINGRLRGGWLSVACSSGLSLWLLALALALPVWADSDSLAVAYQQQRQAVVQQLAGSLPAGFKAALNSPDLQQRFAATAPVMGVLLADAVNRTGTTLAMAEFGKPMLEVELAFRFIQPVTQLPQSAAALSELVAEVAPALELPDLGLVSSPPDVLGIVRANAAAKRVIVGPAVPVRGIQPDDVTLRLLRGQAELYSVMAGQLDGGQWQALYALVAEVLRQGWDIGPEQWLITGAIGGMQALTPGRYQLQSSIGEVTLTVTP